MQKSLLKTLVALWAGVTLATGCGDDSMVTTGAKADSAAGAQDTALTADGGATDGAGHCAPSQCDDNNPCTDDQCDDKGDDKGVCSHVERLGPCSDGNACTLGDQCDKGACVGGGSQVACTDNNPCTADSCDPKSGNCVFLPTAATCDDGDTCTSGDLCASGVCAGTPSCSCATAADCADKNPCTANSCESGKCVAVAMAAGATCSDGNACTQADLCNGSTCAPGKAVVCDDGNSCTDDACLPGVGCVSTANSAACDDGSPCTGSDKCSGGACSGTAVACACKISPDCDDKNSCTQDTCDNGSCAHVATGDGQACDDGNACTTGDTCLVVVCLPSGPTSCDDSNPCTGDACDPKVGCIHAPNASPCDDGNPCTKSDSCANATCSGGLPNGCSDNNMCTDDGCDPASGCSHVPTTVACSDGNPCTDDLCDPASGCSHKNNSGTCSDGDACTLGDLCAGGVCLAGAGTACDDGSACTADTCDKASGCKNSAVADGTVCKDKACLLDNSFEPGAVCLAGACSPKGVIEPCDDKNVCTADACVPSSGCSHVASDVPCDDGTVCTDGDMCSKGACVPGKLLPCDDVNICTSDTCDAKLGCMFVANTAACDDGDACTSGDQCKQTKCQSGGPTDCNDGNVCTDDSCNSVKGCLHLANAGTCSDGSVCTQGDTCLSGACVAGSAVMCNDSNLCTSDSCDPIAGCKFVANSSPCDDGSICTTGDACKAGQCSPGAATNCDDKNVCTDDSCDPLKGCQNKPNISACDDGSVCTGAPDKCVGGVCTGATPSKCDDGNPCTIDICDGGGSCSHANSPDGAVCIAAACGSGGFSGSALCSVGKCGTAPTTTSCDDKNPCTNDICNALSGCQHAVNTALCDDGNACTTGDVCSLGTCTAGAPQNCDDKNICTADSCDKAAGCTWTANSLPCNDGDACTTADNCANGKCMGGPAPNCNDGNPCTADSCDKKTGCVNQVLSDGSSCGTASSCSGLMFQGVPTCQAAKCITPAPQDCNDTLECTTDSCDVAKGCINKNLPFGTSCATAASGQLYPFCAGSVCTGVEPLAAQVSGAVATRGALNGIDRMPGDKLYPVGVDNGLTVQQQKANHAIVATVVHNPLALQFNSQISAASALFAVRTRLAVGSIATNNGVGPLTMTCNPNSGLWQQGGPSLAVPGLNPVQLPLRAVDMVLPLAGPEWFIFGGDGNTNIDGPPTFGFSTFSGSQWSAMTPIQVTTSKSSCANGQNFRALNLADVYAADQKNVFAAGTIAATGNIAAASVVAFWDGALKLSCGGDIGSTFTAVANGNDYSQSLVVAQGNGLGAGAFKAVHGASASHVLVGGSQGTLYSFDNGKWTQQTPQFAGMSTPWSGNFDVHSVFITANEGWVVGVLAGQVAQTACRTGFVLHGSFAGSTWSWDELITLNSEVRTCGQNLDWTNLAHVMIDPSSSSVFAVGSQGTNAQGLPVSSGATQQSELLLRIRTK